MKRWIHATRTARWLKYSMMEALKEERIQGSSGLRGSEPPSVVSRQLKVYPEWNV
jgi:hypothetical protein